MEHHLLILLILSFSLLRLLQGQTFKNADVIEINYDIETKNITQLKGYRFDLTCDGLEIVEKVTWFKDGRAMFPFLIKRQTKNQVLVKPEHQAIEFKSLKHSDNGLYTCVTNDGKQVGHYRITVVTAASLTDMRSPLSWMFWTTLVALVVFIAISSFIYFKTANSY